jgi:predicted acetyltransferase
LASNIRFSYVESEHDLERYCELLNLAFPGEGVDVLGRRLYEHHPEMTARNFYALWDGGRMVATLNLIPQTWSLGGVPLKVAEMGLVGTDPEYRNRGLQKILNKEFDRRTREEGYHLAGLEGIPYFYRQFGYEYSVPLDEWASIPLPKLPEAKSSDISPLRLEEVPEAIRILETSQKKYLVHAVRSRVEWETQEKSGIVGEHASTTYAVRKGGKIKAYLRAEVKENSVLLHEFAGIDEHLAPEVAAFLRHLGEAKDATELISREAYVEPFDEYLFSLGASKRRAYGWQMKVVDHKRILTQLEPVFETRLEASQYKGYTGTLTLDFYSLAVTLSFESGIFKGATDAEPKKRGDILINPRVFPKLLLGYRSLEELEAEYPDMRIKPEYRTLISVLFPKGEGHIHTTY